MLVLLRLLFGVLLRIFRSRRHLLLENLALRQQLAVLKAKADCGREVVLGHGPETLVGLEAFAVGGDTGNGRSLAQGRVSSLLAMDFQKKRVVRQEED